MPLSAALDLARPFALLEKNGRVMACQGQLHYLKALQDIHDLSRRAGTDVVFVVPYCAIRERGFEARGDEPVLALTVETSLTLSLAEFSEQISDEAVALAGDISPSLSDEEYAARVREVQDKEIGGGNASQIVLSRTFSGQLENFGIGTVLALYRRLLQQGQGGQYMTVLFAGAEADAPHNRQFIIGATPERHIEITGSETVMIPIAGTLRKEDEATFRQRLHDFVADPKEINELFQVMDEELKIINRLCPDGGSIHGPLLREIGQVVHTEYELVGVRTANSIDALRRSMHAPTVTGSPMESAARILARYEPDSRRYYSGEVGIYRRPRGEAANGDLDTAILIRCAEIFHDGRFSVRAGGGIVRDSDPLSEAKETRAKAMGFLGVLTGTAALRPRYLTDALREEIRPALESRNTHVSPFWLARQDGTALARYDLSGLRVTILNNEDDFAFMLRHMIVGMKADATVVDTLACDVANNSADIVIIGPGPGDPTDMTHPRMARIQAMITDFKARNVPMLGVCLGHQSLALHEGYKVTRQPSSTQGLQRTVQVFGEQHRLGFYNSFSPELDASRTPNPSIRLDMDENGRIIALQGDGFIGFQFHPESVMSESGHRLLYKALMILRQYVREQA